MRPTCILTVACALLVLQCHSVALDTSCHQESAAVKGIGSTIRQFFTCMSQRDIEGLRAVLDTRFMGIEAGNPNANVHMIDTADAKEMLPPEGNDDWDNVKVTDVRAQTSATHPSVATASFAFTFPLNDREVSQMERNLSDPQLKLDDAQRQALKKMINAKCITNSMFAILGKRKGQWKIMCMTFPK